MKTMIDWTHLFFLYIYIFDFVEKEKENWESSWSYSSSSSTQQNPFWFVLLNNSAFLALKYEKECMYLVTPKASKYFDPNKRRTTVSVCILLLYYYYYYLNLNCWEREREREREREKYLGFRKKLGFQIMSRAATTRKSIRRHGKRNRTHSKVLN